jgi:hypothetical protein
MQTTTLRALAIAFACLMAVVGVAAPDDPLPFPYVKDADFQPIDIPDWVWERQLVAFGDNASHVEAAHRGGVEVMHLTGCVMYYPLKRDDSSAGMPADVSRTLKEKVDLAKRYGMKVITQGQAHRNLDNLKLLHPEWLLQRSDDSNFVETVRNNPERYDEFCLNSPFGEHYIECMAEILTEYGTDGFSFDGNYLRGLCFCPACKSQYREDSGRELPKKYDMRDLDYRTYMLWAEGKQEAWHRRVAQRLTQINPQAGLLSWTVAGGRYMQLVNSVREMSQRMNLLLGVPYMEWWLDEYHRGATIVSAFGPAYLRAVSGHRVAGAMPYCITHGNPYDQTSFPMHELYAEAMIALTNGIQCPMFSGWYEDTTVRVFGEIGRRAEFCVRAEQIPHAAMLFSDNTRMFYGLEHKEDRYLAHPFGFFRAAYEEHLPLNIIAEWDLQPERLKNYRVLVLPNVACLSDDQVRVIRDYVREGGGLVATNDTSRFDMLGRERKNFALADVFGVDYDGPLKSRSRRGMLDTNFAAGITEKYWDDRDNISEISWQRNLIQSPELTEDAELMHLAQGIKGTCKAPMVKVRGLRGDMKIAAMMRPDGLDESSPAIITGKFGKGRVVYMGVGLDHAYYSYAYPYQRRLLARAIEWAARQPFDIEVHAPMCVQSTFFRQSTTEGNRVVVHLFNDVSSTGNHGRPGLDVPVREEVVPIGGIRVLFRNSNVRDVYLEPEHLRLDARQTPAGIEVSVPSLGLHSMVVARLP